MQKVIIIGTGGNCVDILDAVLELNAGGAAYEVAGFLDDDPAKEKVKFNGCPVLGKLADAGKFKEHFFVFGIGSERNFLKRREILESCKIQAERFISIIHPTASVSRFAKIGAGTVLFQNATITSNAVLGDFVQILPNVVISHDVEIGDYTCITGGVALSGKVKVGADCYLGTNSCVRGGVAIGRGSLIGMGSVVLKDVPEYSVMVGNPARFLKKSSG